MTAVINKVMADWRAERQSAFEGAAQDALADAERYLDTAMANHSEQDWANLETQAGRGGGFTRGGDCHRTACWAIVDTTEHEEQFTVTGRGGEVRLPVRRIAVQIAVGCGTADIDVRASMTTSQAQNRCGLVTEPVWLEYELEPLPLYGLIIDAARTRGVDTTADGKITGLATEDVVAGISAGSETMGLFINTIEEGRPDNCDLPEDGGTAVICESGIGTIGNTDTDRTDDLTLGLAPSAADPTTPAALAHNACGSSHNNPANTPSVIEWANNGLPSAADWPAPPRRLEDADPGGIYVSSSEDGMLFYDSSETEGGVSRIAGRAPGPVTIIAHGDIFVEGDISAPLGSALVIIAGCRVIIADPDPESSDSGRMYGVSGMTATGSPEATGAVAAMEWADISKADSIAIPAADISSGSRDLRLTAGKTSGTDADDWHATYLTNTVSRTAWHASRLVYSTTSGTMTVAKGVAGVVRDPNGGEWSMPNPIADPAGWNLTWQPTDAGLDLFWTEPNLDRPIIGYEYVVQSYWGDISEILATGTGTPPTGYRFDADTDTANPRNYDASSLGDPSSGSYFKANPITNSPDYNVKPDGLTGDLNRRGVPLGAGARNVPLTEAAGLVKGELYRVAMRAIHPGGVKSRLYLLADKVVPFGPRRPQGGQVEMNADGSATVSWHPPGSMTMDRVVIVAAAGVWTECAVKASTPGEWCADPPNPVRECPPDDPGDRTPPPRLVAYGSVIMGRPGVVGQVEACGSSYDTVTAGYRFDRLMPAVEDWVSSRTAWWPGRADGARWLRRR